MVRHVYTVLGLVSEMQGTNFAVKPQFRLNVNYLVGERGCCNWIESYGKQTQHLLPLKLSPRQNKPVKMNQHNRGVLSEQKYKKW